MCCLKTHKHTHVHTFSEKLPDSLHEFLLLIIIFFYLKWFAPPSSFSQQKDGEILLLLLFHKSRCHFVKKPNLAKIKRRQASTQNTKEQILLTEKKKNAREKKQKTQKNDCLITMKTNYSYKVHSHVVSCTSGKGAQHRTGRGRDKSGYFRILTSGASGLDTNVWRLLNKEKWYVKYLDFFL